MQQCFWQGTEHISDDVFKLCGGNARVSILLIKRRHYQVGHLSKSVRYGSIWNTANPSVQSWLHHAL
eukprot:12884891-Prorocentrum_lima.AAC.1